MASAGSRRIRRVLVIVENLPVPFDRRVWQEATTLAANGYEVSVICPKGKGFEASHEELDGIHVYRHSLPTEGSGALGYLAEYSAAIFAWMRLSLKVLFRHGFDVIHACNPPDLIFLVGAFYKLFGKKFVFDHHDLCPELYFAKFEREDSFYQSQVLFERLTFRTANVSISTNDSYRRVAIERGGMPPEKVFVVRSGPKLERLKIVPADPKYRNGRRYVVGYAGVMGRQEGLDLLLESVRYIVHDRKRDDIQFVLVGSGTELPELKRLTAELGVADYVTFTGRVPDDEFVAALCAADVCVNPDRYNVLNDKSTMNKVMEYMALGKPQVQFEMTEGRVSAGEASLYARRDDPVHMAELVLELLADEPRRVAMGALGRRTVEEKWAWPHQVKPLLAAYAALED